MREQDVVLLLRRSKLCLNRLSHGGPVTSLASVWSARQGFTCKVQIYRHSLNCEYSTYGMLSSRVALSTNQATLALSTFKTFCYLYILIKCYAIVHLECFNVLQHASCLFFNVYPRLHSIVAFRLHARVC